MTQSNHIKVFIADDHQMFIDGIKLIFSSEAGYTIIGEALNGNAVLDFFETCVPDVALLDINMPYPNGLELTRIVTTKYPHCKVILLTMYNDETFVKEYLRSGAMGYVIKNAGRNELLAAIHATLDNKRYISKELSYIETKAGNHSKEEGINLTKREIEIIKLLAKGKSSSEIAETLFISVYTVNTHRKNILQKLDVKNTAGVLKAIKNLGIADYSEVDL